MARNTGADCRQCRREGTKLFLKGDRCYSVKCAISKRVGVPGQHGIARKKVTEYGVQLREKQKAKRIYGLLESQFHKYYLMGDQQKGITGTNMLVLLETRLDNVCHRMGLGVSRSQARQLVNHGHITVNGSVVDIASYQIKTGDVISVKESKATNKFFTEIKQMKKLSNLPKWLDFEPSTLTGKVLDKPTREDIDVNIEEHFIIELYSR